MIDEKVLIERLKEFPVHCGLVKMDWILRLIEDLKFDE